MATTYLTTCIRRTPSPDVLAWDVRSIFPVNMKFLNALASHLSSAWVLTAASSSDCKCVSTFRHTSFPKLTSYSQSPRDDCWPSDVEFVSFNTTISGALIKGVPPGSVCYPDQPNYNEEACAFVCSQWLNSTWHAADPISVDYPVWTNNSCNPIYPNGTSVTGDIHAGEKGCSIGRYAVYAVNATTPDQVAASLRWASKKNVRVVVKNTGHSYGGRCV